MVEDMTTCVNDLEPSNDGHVGRGTKLGERMGANLVR